MPPSLYLEQPVLLITTVLLLGLCVGSFLNVVIHRMPKMLERQWQTDAAEFRGETAPDTPKLTLATPRSRCPHCGHLITALENIPLLSYLVLRGRCSHCKAPIGIRYPVIEVLTALLSAAVAWKFGPTLQTAAGLLLIWSLLALTFIDLDTFLLPDDITLPLLWLGLLLNLNQIFVPLEAAVIGAMAGYLSLWSVYWLFKLVTGKEGMGYGDFKLLAALGAFLGWQALPGIILLSSVVGACVGISLMIFAKHGRETPIPFGPYLAAAGVLMLFFGETLSKLFLPL
ncbi:A24 family peptidase [Uliginosibacterium sp. 31-16]|uniref:prepilin peptidase n=1 Tax=Uliginosibacterium sp. 31-16 TaxID=3068315 RepID=UPI00273FA30A|nr:A24 family peptidase [Uliginosibacterium sp. 31-16]MDP5240732.1 A24 family peptidase [Uliginosibacterium sp. 31-16]